MLPENVEAIKLFLRSTTQFRVDSGGLPSGLDYVGLEAVARLSGVELSTALFSKIQALESAWIEAMRDRRKRLSG